MGEGGIAAFASLYLVAPSITLSTGINASCECAIAMETSPMKVRIAGTSEEVIITPDDVDGDVRWVASILCEGALLDGRRFRCVATPAQWEQFLTR